MRLKGINGSNNSGGGAGGMDVREYKYVLTVVKSGSITAASAKLNISQPSLSAYIKNLERKAGIKFFYKSEGLLRLTSEGKLYLDYAQKIVDLDESLSLELQKIQNLDSGEVNMGITATRGMFYLHRILPVLKKKYPGFTIKLSEVNSNELLEKMIYDREIDFAIMSSPFIKYNLEYEILLREEIVVTVPSEDPVCDKAKKKAGRDLPWLDLRLLKDHDFIFLKKGQRLREAADKLFEEAGMVPKILIETRSAITAYNLSEAGLGPSITAAGFRLIHSSPRVCYFSTGNSPLVYEAVIAFHSRQTLSNTASAIIAEIKNMFKTADWAQRSAKH
jgi:DNA-binding transcriptional LysR family regulator